MFQRKWESGKWSSSYTPDHCQTLKRELKRGVTFLSNQETSKPQQYDSGNIKNTFLSYIDPINLLKIIGLVHLVDTTEIRQAPNQTL